MRVYKVIILEKKIIVDYVINNNPIFNFMDSLEEKYNLNIFTRVIIMNKTISLN